jgi:acyl-CoA synthetase (AMP-forming)/AMP-acid ligase II
MNRPQPPRFMADIPRRGARERPQQPAVHFDDRVLTYAMLDERSNRVANGLSAFIPERQSRVAVLDFNSAVFAEIFFGTAKIDCATVGINARLAGPEVLHIVNDSAARVLFVGAGHYALVEQIAARFETVAQIVAIDGGHPRWQAYDAWRDAQRAGDPALELCESSDVIQLYTSGTTGLPKGVCHTNRSWNLFARAGREAEWGGFDADTVTFVCMPLFHVAGFNLLCLTLAGSGTAVLTRKSDVAEILRAVPRYRVTDTLFVPAMISAILAHPEAAATDFSSLRLVCYGAAPIADDVLHRARGLFGCGFVHLYGLTENLGAGTYLPSDMHRAELGKLRSCGRPYAGSALKIIDETGAELPAGAVGEILIRCDWIMRGYWRNTGATEETVRDGWLHSGDAGYLDDDGYLYIHDRIKDMIVSGAENVYPAEVENALMGHPALADVAVIGVPDDRWGEAVKAIVVLKPGAALDPSDILEFARRRIAGYKVPKSIDVIEVLPRNASGKVLRRELREPYWQGHARRVH